MKTRSILRPTKPLQYYIEQLVDKSTRSAVITTTPQYANQLLTLKSQVPQLVLASVDNVANNNERDGFSICSFDRPLQVKDYTPLISDDSFIGKRSWDLSKSFLNMEFTENSSKQISSIVLPVASTLFTTSTSSTLAFVDGESSGLLNSLRVELPIATDEVQTHMSLSELTPAYTISECRNNMLMRLNGKAASAALSSIPKISKSSKIYATVSSADSKRLARETFEVVAGGGEWGSRSDILVLDPAANLTAGDSIQFFLLDPSLESSVSAQFQVLATEPLEELAYSQESGEEIRDRFSIGSEDEITFNGRIFPSGSIIGLL